MWLDAFANELQHHSVGGVSLHAVQILHPVFLEAGRRLTNPTGSVNQVPPLLVDPEALRSTAAVFAS